MYHIFIAVETGLMITIINWITRNIRIDKDVSSVGDKMSPQGN